MLKPADIASQTPGLSTVNATSGGTPIFAIRGIGLDDFNINNNSGVGVYLDQVFAASPMMLSSPLFDVERVEVLKGPQGTLYGKNTTGGAVNFISRRPTDELDGYFSAGYGRWDTIELSGAISGPLSDQFKGRIAGTYVNQGDGWQTDIDTGQDVGDVDLYAVRGSLSFEPTATVDALLNVHYNKDDSQPLSPQSVGSEAAGDALAASLGLDFLPGLDFAGIPLEGRVDTSSNPEDVRLGGLDLQRDEEGFGVVLTLNAEFEWLAVTSITAWDGYERFVVDNIDGIPGANYDFRQDDELTQFSQEILLTSNTDGRVDWILGVNYSDDDVDVDDSFDVTQTFTALELLDTGLSVSRARYKQKTESLGMFIHTETHLTDQWDLIVALRYSSDERSFTGSVTDETGGGVLFFSPGAVPVPPPLVIDSLDEAHDEDDVSYRIGLKYALNDAWLIYGNVATGYKTGVFYAAPVVAPGPLAYVKPEEVFSYEVGFKASVLNDTLRFNGAYFHYDYDDRQSLGTIVLPTGGFDNTLTNIEESEIDGFELDLSWLPLASLDIKTGVGYLDTAVLTPFTSIRGFPTLTAINSGDDLAQAPEWSYSALVGYERNLSDKLYGRLQFDYTWSDEQVSALGDPSHNAYGSYSSLGARLSVATPDDSLEFALWGRNLTDENSVTYAYINFLDGQTVYRQYPRSYGATITYSFK